MESNDARLKIVHILKTGGYSGAEYVVLSIIKYLSHKYDFTYISPSGKIDEILCERNINHFVLKKFSISELQSAINELQPDIIHAHGYSASFVAGLLRTRAKTISHIHGNPVWIKKINIRSIAYLIASRKIHKIVSVSEKCISEYVFKRFIKSYYVIGNPVDLNYIVEQSKVARNQDVSDILFLGRLAEPKDPLRFIEIINKIAKNTKKLKVIMVGDGELKDECKKKIRELGLQEIIDMKGFVKNPYGIIRNTKILCVPSKWEGFGLVVIEAFALGKPVVGSGVGGMRELLATGAGMICEADSEFIDAINVLLHRDDKYREKCLTCEEVSKKINNIESYINRMIEIYEEVL